MAVETVHADGLATDDPGSITGASNAYGTTTATWTTNIDNSPWTAHFTLDNTTDSPDATNSVGVLLRARKQDGTDHPTIDSVAIRENGTTRGTNSTGWTVSSLTGQDVSLTVSCTGMAGDGSDLEIVIATTAAGGSPAKRSAVQLDYMDVDVTTSPAAAFYQRSINATSTVTAALSEKRFFDRAIAATSTVTPSVAKSLSAFRSFDATSTVTPVLGKVASFFRALPASVAMNPQQTEQKIFTVSMSATTTATPSLGRQAYYDEAVAAATTATPAMSLKSTRYITLSYGSAFTPDLQRAGAATTPVSLSATSTVTPAMSDTFTARRTLSVNSTVSPVVSPRASFFRTLAATFTSVLGQLPGGGGQFAYRAAAARKHGDALWWFIQQNEQGNYTSRVMIGALNEINGTHGVEYREARQTYLDRANE